MLPRKPLSIDVETNDEITLPSLLNFVQAVRGKEKADSGKADSSTKKLVEDIKKNFVQFPVTAAKYRGFSGFLKVDFVMKNHVTLYSIISSPKISTAQWNSIIEAVFPFSNPITLLPQEKRSGISPQKAMAAVALLLFGISRAKRLKKREVTAIDMEDGLPRTFPIY